MSIPKMFFHFAQLGPRKLASVQGLFTLTWRTICQILEWLGLIMLLMSERRERATHSGFAMCLMTKSSAYPCGRAAGIRHESRVVGLGFPITRQFPQQSPPITRLDLTATGTSAKSFMIYLLVSQPTTISLSEPGTNRIVRV